VIEPGGARACWRGRGLGAAGGGAAGSGAAAWILATTVAASIVRVLPREGE
jgi:hypothetical protein